MLLWNHSFLDAATDQNERETFLVEPVSSPKMVCNLRHLSWKQIHRIVKCDSALIGNLRNLQNIHDQNKWSKWDFVPCFEWNIVYTGHFTSMLKANQYAYMLFDLLSVDNRLKLLTIINCSPFLRWKYDSTIELNKHGQSCYRLRSSLRNDDNGPGLTNHAAAEERQELSSKNTRDGLSDAITGGKAMGLW